MTKILVHCAVVVGFGMFYALWRRCYGGWDTPIWKKLFPKHGSALHRNFWRVVDLAAVFCLLFFYAGVAWWWALYAAVVVQFVLWDWSFGMYMGIGRHAVPPPEEEIEEYEDQVFAPALGWLFDERDRYGAFYDFVGMSIRFAVPGLLLWFVPTLGGGMIALGLIIGLAYFMDVRFSEKGIKNWIARNFSELAAGCAAGVAIAA